jgi:hypothetical protein
LPLADVDAESCACSAELIAINAPIPALAARVRDWWIMLIAPESR